MKKHKLFKKVVLVISVICIASTFIFGAFASDTTENDIVGEWVLNEHIASPNVTQQVEIIQNITFTYVYNGTVKQGYGFIFNIVDDPDATYIYKMGIITDGGADWVYEGWWADGGWSGGVFNSNFSRTIRVTSAYGGQSNLNEVYNWLMANATKQAQTTGTTYFTINNVSTLITFNTNSTWRDWIGSNYDQTNIYTDNTYVYKDNQRMYDNSGNWVKVDDKISSYNSPTNAYFFRSFDLTFTINDGKTTRTFTYLSTLSTWEDYVPTNPDFSIAGGIVYYLGTILTQGNNDEVDATDTINDRMYLTTYSIEWYEGYDAGYIAGMRAGGSNIDIGSIIDATVNSAKNIFINAFGFELFGINIASTLISILVIAIVIWVVKKLR